MLLAGVLAGSLDGVLALRAVRDAAGCIEDFEVLLANPAAEAIIGWSARRLVGRSTREIFPGLQAGALLEALGRVIDTGAPLEKQFAYDRNGLQRWIHLRAVRLEDGVAVTFREIPEARLAEITRAEGEARYRLLAERVTDMIIRHGPDGACLYVSPACRPLTGYDPEALSRVFPMLLHPEDRAQAVETLGAVARGEVVRNSYRLRRKDRRYVWLETTARGLFDEAGRLQEIVSASRDISGRKRFEEALRASETRYRSLFEQASDAIFICHADEGLVEANARLCEMLGYAREELLGRAPGAFVTGGEREDLAACLSRLRATGASLVERELRRRDGTTFLAELSLSCVDGVLVQAIVRDITERKEAERVRLRLASIVESSAYAIVGKTPDGIVTDWNAAAEELYGYRAEEIVGRSIAVLVPPDRAGELAQILGAIRRGERIDRLETVRVRKDGTRLDVLLTVSPFRDGSGRIVGASVIAYDVTERKRAEETLRIQERAIAAASSGVLIADARRPDLPIVYCNPAFERITSYTREEVLGRHWRFLKGPDTAPEAVQEVEAAMAARRGCHTVLKNYRRDGTPFWSELSISPVFDAEGQLTHFVAVQTDITRRKDTEEQLTERSRLLRRSRKRLKRQSRALVEANRRLQENQAQLVHSEKMASLGQLAAGVAHEINNPVGFVLSNLHTLSEYVGAFKALLAAYGALADALGPAVPAAQQALLEQVSAIQDAEDVPFLLQDVEGLLTETKAGARQIADIVQSLKSFARVDEADRKEADVNDGIRATLRMLWNELKYKCTVHEDLRPLPPIRCFPGQLNQVFMNLLMNAVQATEEQGTITIETAATDAAVIVRIADTGSGIAPENIPRIFNPFFTTKPVGRGTGLGLSISYGIIRKHNGRIEVDSEVGRGTTFTITLPIQEETYA